MNGLLLQYTDDPEKEQFFPIETLHYCAAVRFVNISGYSVAGGGQQFLPLDSPLANLPDSRHPPIFAAILRRTTGVRVLECHAFVCTAANATNALVSCCFHAYAESSMINASVSTLRRKPSGLRSLDDEKAIAEGTHSDRSSSAASELAFENGYESGSERNDDQGRKGAEWHRRRQQAGELDAASLSSSAAGRYKKKEPKRMVRNWSPSPAKVPENPYPTFSRALVPYGVYQQTVDRRRSVSESDLRVRPYSSAHPGDALVPYEPYVTYPNELVPFDRQSMLSVRAQSIGPPMMPFPPMPLMPFHMGPIPPPPPLLRMPPPPPLRGPPPHPQFAPFPPATVLLTPPRRTKKKLKAKKSSPPDMPLLMPAAPFAAFEEPPFPPGMMPPFAFMGGGPPQPRSMFRPMEERYWRPFADRHHGMAPLLETNGSSPLYGEAATYKPGMLMNGKGSQAFGVPEPVATARRGHHRARVVNGLDEVDGRMRGLRIRDSQDAPRKPRANKVNVQMMY
uniref:PID domain-containing protein n=1 Tax=Trichuris muris TaxID=70415 RepID=A0A5S6Q5Q2_TRIMR